MIANKPTTLLCTYPLTVSKAGDVFDVIRAHQFAVAKHKDKWEVVTAPAVGRDRHIEAVDAATRVSSLSLRERQVLDAIIDGDPNKIIARNLAIDVRTVEAHRARLMRRLGVRAMVEAVRLGDVGEICYGNDTIFNPLDDGWDSFPLGRRTAKSPPKQTEFRPCLTPERIWRWPPGARHDTQFSHFTLSQKQIGRNRLRQVA